MKTTIDISDGLFKEVKRYAGRKGTTFREVLETSLRSLLKNQAKGKKAFQLRKHSFRGKGLVEGLVEGQWAAIREKAYEGRGG